MLNSPLWCKYRGTEQWVAHLYIGILHCWGGGAKFRFLDLDSYG